MWYVIQVNTGDEENVLSMCARIVKEETYNDLFIPRYVCSRRYLGNWHNDALIMFPGYLFVDTDDIEDGQHQQDRQDDIHRGRPSFLTAQR